MTSVVDTVHCGQVTLRKLKDILTSEKSRYRDGSMEGLVVRKEGRDWLETRAKLVHPDFTQAIDQHWSRRQLEWNRLGEAPQ